MTSRAPWNLFNGVCNRSASQVCRGLFSIGIAESCCNCVLSDVFSSSKYFDWVTIIGSFDESERASRPCLRELFRSGLRGLIGLLSGFQLL